jgi:hypothetical protein
VPATAVAACAIVFGQGAWFAQG